jgi:DNA-binding XRE family transcriptional regulator
MQGWSRQPRRVSAPRGTLAGRLLTEWRQRHGLDQKSFAVAIGVLNSSLCHYERGAALPRIDKAVLIERMTDGCVPVWAWVREREAQAA